METQTPETESTRGDISVNQTNKDESNSRMEGFIKDELNCLLNEKELAKGEVDPGRGSFENENNSAPIGDGHLTVLKQKVFFLKFSRYSNLKPMPS